MDEEKFTLVQTLSSVEFSLFLCLIMNPEILLPRLWLYQQVWNSKATFIPESSNVLDVYMNYLRNRLREQKFGKILHTIPTYGVVLSEVPPPQIIFDDPIFLDSEDQKKSPKDFECISKMGDFVLDLKSRHLIGRGITISLTARELELLSFLMAHSGRFHSLEKLNSQVWKRKPGDEEISSYAPAVCVCSIRKKLGSHRHLLENSRGKGFRWNPAAINPPDFDAPSKEL
jgi:DNA-binding response OmpR family regulator